LTTPPLSRKDNLSPSERTALRTLQHNSDITTKPVDKGSATVVMNTSDYIDAAEKQLSGQRYYKQVQSDPTSKHAKEIAKTLSEMKRHEYIDDKTFEHLDTTDVKAGRFYLQPQTHKEGYRPIISTNGHPTERISGFLDYHMRPFVTALPSYVHDTTDYLSKTKQSENTLLLTMDVVLLYTNIPHDEGIEACKEAWDTRGHTHNISGETSHSCVETEQL
jgi:hypothetical protein